MKRMSLQERYQTVIPRVIDLILRDVRKAAFHQQAVEARFYLVCPRAWIPIFFWQVISSRMGFTAKTPSATDTRWMVRRIARILVKDPRFTYQAQYVTEGQEEYLKVSWG